MTDDQTAATAVLTEQSTPARLEGLTAVELDGETVLYDEQTGALHLLDQIATMVWGLLDGEASVAQTADELAEEFGAPPAQVRADVLGLVQDFGARGLLVGVPQADASAAS